MANTNYIAYHTELSANIIAFCRYLRDEGLSIGPLDQADTLRALAVIPFSNPDTFRLSLRAVLTKSLADQKKFDELYQDYWDNLSRAVDSKVKQRESASSQSRKKSPRPEEQTSPTTQSLKDWLNMDKSKKEEEAAAYSAMEVLTRKDFSGFTEDEVEEVMKLIAVIARSLALRYNRRFKQDIHSGNFDLRRTMRLNMRRGGEIIDLAFRQRRIRRLKLVMICDVSKSMDLYSRFLVQFIYGFQSVYRRIETFVFSTSLHRVTEHLQTGIFSEALKQLSDSIPDWSGGTKIGASLKTFVDEYGAKMLNDRTVVLIMSDGWDTGNIEALAESMRKIHQTAARVIWLNPLAGNSEYEPVVRGMQAALPYIDFFAPVHNLESLRNLVNLLSSSKGKLRYRTNPNTFLKQSMPIKS